MLRCKEVSRLCASEEIHRAPLARRLAVRLHLMMCDHCSRYVRELRLIGAAVRAEFGNLLMAPARVKQLESTIRNRMEAESEKGHERP